MKEREAGRRAVPLGYQAAIFWFGAKAVANQVFFCRDHGVRFAFILRKPADKVQD